MKSERLKTMVVDRFRKRNIIPAREVKKRTRKKIPNSEKERGNEVEMSKRRQDSRRKKTALRRRDLRNISLRPNGRGIFLEAQWCFENGKLVMKFSKSGCRNRWGFTKSRIPYKYARHGERGENRTNSCASKTRQGLDAVCRYMKYACPDICYDNFFYLKFSDHGGGTSNLIRSGAVVQNRVASHFFSLDALRQGFFLKKPHKPENLRRYNG